MTANTHCLPEPEFWECPPELGIVFHDLEQVEQEAQFV